MRGSRKGGGDVEVQIPNLTATLAQIKGFSPKLARDLRKDLRSSGDEIITAQKAILSGPLPRRIRHSGHTLKRVQPKGRKGYFRKVRTFEETDDGGGRSRGMRAAIASGLKTRVIAGKTRQGIQIRTTRSVGPMSRVWQSRRFRHRVFGTDVWADQQGQPYFWKPVADGHQQMRRRVGTAIDQALDQISKD